MKKVFIVISILLLCSCNKKYDELQIGYSSNMLSIEDRNIIKSIFKDNNISNIDLFFELLDDYNKEEDLECGLQDWINDDNFENNEFKCADRYEKNHNMSDGNCRITAFMLIQDLLKINVDNTEHGSYLMFDFDVILNNDKYLRVKNDKQRFISLFNEMDVSKISKEDYINVFPNKLKDYYFKIDSDKVSLISVIINDSDFNLLFVGHAGVLINLEDKYLFIEKIAFEQPYQVHILRSKNDLISLFKKRVTYFGDGSKMGPYVYEDDKLIYEYK